MSSAAGLPRSLAARASWVSLGLSLGCVAAMFGLQLLAAIVPFESMTQGVLVGIVPRALLCGLVAVAALGSLVGIVSLTLIRRRDFEPLAILGILIRSLLGIGIGIVSGIVLWLIIGHLVIGF